MHWIGSLHFQTWMRALGVVGLERLPHHTLAFLGHGATTTGRPALPLRLVRELLLPSEKFS